MTLTDLVWISVGELLLAGTFALGILVGVSLNRKGQRNGDSNTRTENDWNHAGNLNATGGPGRRAQGCADKAREAHPAQRPTR